MSLFKKLTPKAAVVAIGLASVLAVAQPSFADDGWDGHWHHWHHWHQRWHHWHGGWCGWHDCGPGPRFCHPVWHPGFRDFLGFWHPGHWNRWCN